MRRHSAFLALLIGCGGSIDNGTATGTGGSGGSSQGVADTAGATSQGGTVATGGSSQGGVAGCVERNERYSDGTVFPYNSGISISQLPECILTCSANENSIQVLPAGVCNLDPTCSVMVLLLLSPESGAGVWHYYVCACNSDRWACESVVGD